MQSLKDLNTLSTSAVIEFTDDRTADVIFDRTTATAQILSIEADTTHTVPVGINIEEIINYVDNATTYTVNVSAISGATVTWPVIPAGCTVTNPSTGVYKIAGINSVATWTTVKSPNVFVPSTFTGTQTYAATITYKNNTATKTWNINVTAVVLITNMTLSRNYYKNSANSIFASNIPEITDTNEGNFTISLSSTLGKFKTDSTGADTTWTYSGTKAQVNAVFSTIKFYPTANSYASGNFTYMQYYEGTLQTTKTGSLAGNNSTAGTRTQTFNSSTTWVPDYAYAIYGFDALLVAAGGGAAVGGGGGGGVAEYFNLTASSASYSIVVGTGGAAAIYDSGTPNTTGATGGNTSAFGYTVYGGLGGKYTYLGGTQFNLSGGDSGAPTTFTGGAYTYSAGTNTYAGGGGAGANQNGISPTVSPFNAPGGAGKLSTITGSYYGGGGGGAANTSGTNGDNGGLGGGGDSYNPTAAGTTAGTANTGGGGGAGWSSVAQFHAKAGGSGVVVIKLKG